MLYFGMVETKHTTVDLLLIATKGNQTEVARLLRINRNTLRSILSNGRPNIVIVDESGDEIRFTLLTTVGKK